MSRALRALGLLAAGIVFVAGQAQAQQVAYEAQPGSKVWIVGTSNKSDFNVNATEFTAAFTMNRDVSGNDPGLTAAKVAVTAGKIVSGKSTIMDRLMYDALKVEEHPQITYELISARPAGSGDAISLQTRGRLTLAGQTKEIDMTVQGERLANGQVRFTGEHPLRMSEYGIEPPSAMFGALRTKDDVTIHFDVVVAPK